MTGSNGKHHKGGKRNEHHTEQLNDTKLDNKNVGNVCVVGAGLAGNMVAALLVKLGYAVTIFEKRPDDVSDTEPVASKEFGTSTSAVKRSVNLALSYRGQCALQEVGLLEDVMSQAIRMPRRVIHMVDGTVKMQYYGKPEDAIWSVSRQGLNQLLLERAKKMSTYGNEIGATVKFNRSLISTDATTGRCSFQNLSNGKVEDYTFDLVIGADGAYSTVRDCMLRQSRINYSREYVAHGYKELSIPPKFNNGRLSYAMPNHNGLHIWPRGQFMLVALPNPDYSFTATLFAPYKGTDGCFESIDLEDDNAIKKHFATHFPDVLDMMPDLVNDFKQNPVGSLLTVRLEPWNYGKIVLIGDAAHAIVPFYGQGMNAAFEDALRLYEILKGHLKGRLSDASGTTIVEEYGHVKATEILTKAAEDFSKMRIPSTNALADVSLEHYHDMAVNTASDWHLAKTRVEAVLHWAFPKLFIPMYTMVAFTDMPVHEVVIRAEKQDTFIGRLVGAGFLTMCVGVIYGVSKAVTYTLRK